MINTKWGTTKNYENYGIFKALRSLLWSGKQFYCFLFIVNDQYQLRNDKKITKITEFPRLYVREMDKGNARAMQSENTNKDISLLPSEMPCTFVVPGNHS